MSAQTAQRAPSADWPEGALYYSPRGLYPFQADHIAQVYVGIQSGVPGWMVVWDMGLGKSHMAMQTAALGFEDGTVDFVLLVCERRKLKEWKQDFEEFTKLDVQLHHGPRRKNLFHQPFLPQVVITTYETGRTDLVHAETPSGKRRKVRKLTPGPLLTHALVHAQHPMIVFDESDRLSHRSSQLYRAYEYALNAFRKSGRLASVLALTGTPIRTDWENAFNQGRLVRPDSMPLIKEFKQYFVRARDHYGRALYRDYRMGEFADLMSGMLLAKSKTDPDVIEQFPKITEESLWVDLEEEQRKLYALVEALEGVPGQLTALRQICAHPAALVHSATQGESKLARMLVDELGEDYLKSMPSAKAEALTTYLEPVVKAQEDKAIVFTRWGPSVIPHLRAALTAKGIPVRTHDEEDGIEQWKAAEGGCVLLCSDAVARGVNLPEASYLVEYDMSASYGLRDQRLNRASRIGSGGPSLTVRSMITRETVEVPLMYSMLKGHHQADTLLGRGVTGEQYLTASMRREVLEQGM
jgi:SNF2 family DNA or RNA helicase